MSEKISGLGSSKTENKATELSRRDALLKAGALQNAILNSANFSLIATDEKGVIQLFNFGAERMLGYAALDVINKITPADISDQEEVIARAKALSEELQVEIAPGFDALVYKASRGLEDIYELTYLRQDKSLLPAIVSVTALYDEERKLIGYLLIGTDNTARKQVDAVQKTLDQRLREQQFYTRSLIEANVDAIIVTNQVGVITDVNKQTEALTKHTREELIGTPFKAYFTNPEKADVAIELALSEKVVTDYELTARAKDGNETLVSYNATTFYDQDQKLQGVFAAARDVTDRKRMEQALREKNEELEIARAAADKANQAKSEFLSSMSHELRTPLNSILGFAQLMDFDSSTATPFQKESLGQILSAGWYLVQLINEILDLALIESGKLSMTVEPVPLSEVIFECQGMIESQAKQRGIDLKFPAPNGAHFVFADRVRLKQVLINLLSNAIKYNKPSGSITLEYSEVTPGSIRISVKDTGVGLSREKLAQLFQPFNRLGQEKTAVEGTGIGLVVSKLLVGLMDGLMGVESTFGVGSVFWFELKTSDAPRLDASKVATKSAPRTQQKKQSCTLLYVEDNKANMKLVEQIIARRPNMEFLGAGDGSSGIELARKHLPEVILMDINLPGLSGFQTLAILREDPATAHIPVLAISASAMVADIKKGLEAGFFRYLTKPINVSVFMDALDEALEFVDKTSEQLKGEPPPVSV